MVTETVSNRFTRFISLLFLVILPLASIFAIVQVLSAEENAPSGVGLSVTKMANSTTIAGGQIDYTIVVSNGGTTDVTGVVVTDTLPTAVSYISGTLTAIGGGTPAENNGTINWTGTVTAGQQITITFSGWVTDTVTPGTIITNTAFVTATGSLITDPVSTTVVTPTKIYMPIIFKSVPAISLLSVSAPSSTDGYATQQWTASWSTLNDPGVTYELQESQDPNFSTATTYNAGSASSYQVSHSLTANNVYYYRVRAVINGMAGPWSNVLSRVVAYRDNFNQDNGWAIRRQDTDDVDNSIYLQNGNLVVKIGGRWDYAIASPLVKVPSDSYRITTRVKHADGVDNLHSYGIIFGGDWDGSACPNNSYTSCFTHYYRLNVIWYGAPNSLRIQLKRIDYHDSRNNAGRGVELIGFTDVTVNGDPADWHEWSVEVNADGTIKIFVDGNQVGQAIDSTYISDPYFGVFASDDEYLGSEPNFDWYQVTPLP